MSISGSNSFLLSPNQVNSAAATGAIQPGQMVLVPASLFQSGQVDTTQFQPVGTYDPSMMYAQGPVQQGGYYYGGNNPIGNGFPMIPPPGSPILGGQTEPTLPGSTTTNPNTGIGQSPAATQMLGQMMQMMISMMTMIMQMLQKGGVTAGAGDVTGNNEGQTGNNNGGHHGKCGGH